MTVFQLKVWGPDKNGTTARAAFYSRRLFKERHLAVEHLPEMRRLCCGDGLLDLEEITGHTVLELEVVE